MIIVQYSLQQLVTKSYLLRISAKTIMRYKDENCKLWSQNPNSKFALMLSKV
jgi:hypothetical protein